MRESKHREPTLFIVGNPERKDEIKHIIEDEWGGNCDDSRIHYGNPKAAYYIGTFGIVICCNLDNYEFTEAVANGWMKEYKLPEQPKFKPFDKVVVRVTNGDTWYAGFFSHTSRDKHPYILTNSFSHKDCLPFNEDTAKLIGTRDEWKGGDE